jgi:uncharacterized protein (DUF305 family)
VVISNRQLLIVSAAVAAALGVGIVVGVQLGDDGPAGARVVQPGAPGQAGRTLSPGDLDAISPPAHNAADTLFMQQMIPHHAQALEMTALVDDRTRSEDLALLAERIEASQQTEIDQMQAWLTERHEEVPAAHDHHSGHHPDLMPGMLTEDQLTQLAAARSAEFDRLFLEFMIRHHQGALRMVEQLYATGGGIEPASDRFAREVNADQNIEIRRMATMLADRSG